MMIDTEQNFEASQRALVKALEAAPGVSGMMGYMETKEAVIQIIEAHLLANGERVEPDYEAAAEVYANHRPGVGPVTDRKRVKDIVDAAIGDKFLVDHPTEEE